MTGPILYGAGGAAAGIVVGWAAGRAHQRAADAWAGLRAHIRMTRSRWRHARRTTAEALGIVALAVAVLGVVAAILLTHR